jgi:hypothetical protein
LEQKVEVSEKHPGITVHCGNKYIPAVAKYR